MSKIKIENFGPIKSGFQENNGFLNIEKNTLFIGNQGSGKSTVAKLISTLSWLEKSINRGDTDKNILSRAKFKEITKYHKIQNYFTGKTHIEYIGEKYSIKYDKNTNNAPTITEIDNSKYIVPKIMYVPSERNFLSAISDAYNVRGLADNVFTFAEELKKAQKSLNGKEVSLEISDYKYGYNEYKDSSFIIGNGYRINLLEASSGIQSFTPLYLVSRNLSLSLSEKEEKMRKNMSVNQSLRMDKEIAELMLDKSIPENNKLDKIDLIRTRYYNKCFFNIVEEPEQNLFPTTQWEMLKCLLNFNNSHPNNKLLITTHSPYLINYLPLAIKGFELYNKCISEKLLTKISKVVPRESTINPKNLAIYEFNETKGSIIQLDDYKGIPSDENYLNNNLGEINNFYINLLEIEDQCH